MISDIISSHYHIALNCIYINTKCISCVGMQSRMCYSLQLWKYPCAQVIFDTDPAPSGHPPQLQVEEMSQAIIKYVTIEYICEMQADLPSRPLKCVILTL